MPRASVLCLALAAFFLAGCPQKPRYPTCKKDEDCKEGEKCVNQRCVQCADDTDCKEGERCRAGGCEPIPGACSSDADCPPGEECQNGRCVAAENRCSSDDDCPEDEDCVNGVCQKVGEVDNADLPSCQLEPLFFDFNQDVLSEEAKSSLQRNVDCISSTTMDVAVIGHADPRGTEEYNIALSDRRARAVADYMARLGVDPVRLRIIPKGETEATGTDESTWAKDRRVEFEWERR